MIKKNLKFRVRFAPSPTGWMHIGGLRTALYNYLLAKQRGGKFILRIEDTDQTRLVSGAVAGIITILERCGLKWDEGSFLKKGKFIEKGKFAPYTQSSRLVIYRRYAEELIQKGGAYLCFCSPQRLEQLRHDQQLSKQALKYDGHCRNLAIAEVKKILAEKVPAVIRLKVPSHGETVFNDLIHGQVSFANNLLDDQVLLKSDGWPTYHLASVVDDHLMKISLVARGEEWLPSTPKHLLLYQALGWSAPQFAHVPLLLNEDKTKLSKRHGEVAVEDYLKRGFLPEALINFIALLGWNPGTEQEIFSLKELVKQFSLERVQQAGAVLNLTKLDWLNGHYIRKMSVDKLAKACLPYLIEAKKQLNLAKIKQIVALEQERLKKLSDITAAAEIFFKKSRYDPKILIWKKSDQATTLARLARLQKWFDSWRVGDWTDQQLKTKTLEMIGQENLDNGATLWPMRVALSGRETSPGPFEIAAILGKQETLARIEAAIDILERTL